MSAELAARLEATGRRLARAMRRLAATFARIAQSVWRDFAAIAGAAAPIIDAYTREVDQITWKFRTSSGVSLYQPNSSCSAAMVRGKALHSIMERHARAWNGVWCASAVLVSAARLRAFVFPAMAVAVKSEPWRGY